MFEKTHKINFKFANIFALLTTKPNGKVFTSSIVQNHWKSNIAWDEIINKLKVPSSKIELKIGWNWIERVDRNWMVWWKGVN